MGGNAGLLARVRRLPVALRLLLACVLCLLIGALIIGGVLWLDGR